MERSAPYFCRLGLGIAVGLSLLVSTIFAISFDGTFGSGGKFITSFSDTGTPSSGASDVFLQPSGRIVIIGTHTQDGVGGRKVGLSLAGLTSAGVLDSGFGTGGKVLVWNSTSQRFLNNSVMMSDGSVLVLHQQWETAALNRPSVVKLSPDGQVDVTFNTDLDLVPNQTNPVRITNGSGGKVYVLVRNGYQFSLVRLNANGSRDTTFGPNGVRSLNLNRIFQPTIFDLRELEGGKLLVAGTYYSLPTYEGLTFVARFDSDTNLDRSFGIQGVTRIAIAGGSVGGDALALQPDGKILIGGYWTFLGSNALLLRLTPRGRLDTSFGTGGIAMSAFNDINGIRGIALAPDGKILVSGGSGDKALPSNQRVLLMKYSANGMRESSLITNFVADQEAVGNDIVLQPDGKMVIAGHTYVFANNSGQFAAARLVP